MSGLDLNLPNSAACEFHTDTTTVYQKAARSALFLKAGSLAKRSLDSLHNRPIPHRSRKLPASMWRVLMLRLVA